MSKSVSGYYKTKKEKKKKWHEPLSHWCREGKTLVVRPLKKLLFLYVCLPSGYTKNYQCFRSHLSLCLQATNSFLLLRERLQSAREMILFTRLNLQTLRLTTPGNGECGYSSGLKYGLTGQNLNEIQYICELHFGKVL